MIPYELIIPSSSRPHLLGRVLESLFAHVDQLPTRVILHDDAVFPDRREAVAALVQDWAARTHRQFVVAYADPPIKHGPSLHWLLRHVVQPYVLYSQDDHVVVRDLPIARALGILSIHGLNQIRFNKRDTMDKKGREGQEFHKVEYRFGDPAGEVTLCAADHWYFQTGLWRVNAIKPVVDWWMRPEIGGGGPASIGAFTEHCEVKINDVFNAKYRGRATFPAAVPICATPAEWNQPAVRARVHKTFIWGPIGEPKFVDHIGGAPEDWALERANRDSPATS